MSQVSKLSFETFEDNDSFVVILKGQICHPDDFKTIKVPSYKPLHLHLKTVRMISSIGIAAWIKWMETLSELPEIKIFEASKAMVDQFNMVQNFLPKQSKVHSFYAPFWSEKTEEDKLGLLVYGDHFRDGTLIQLPKVYDSEGHEMDLDIVPEKYFRFLKANT